MTRIVDLSQWMSMPLLQDFIADYDEMVKRVFVKKIPTAFARYNEWEYFLMTKKKFIGAGHIWETRDCQYRLADDLLEAYTRDEPGYVYGIASTQHPEANQWYKNNAKTNLKNLTFATLFCNYNYRNFANIIKDIREWTVLIANEKAASAVYPFKVVDMISVPNDVVGYYEKNKDEIIADIDLLASKWHNTLFLFCAGPLSNVLIDYARKKNKTNRYIDIGSILDVYTYSTKTRQYFIEWSKTFNQIDTLWPLTTNNIENQDTNHEGTAEDEAIMKTLDSRQKWLMYSFKPTPYQV